MVMELPGHLEKGMVEAELSSSPNGNRLGVQFYGRVLSSTGCPREASKLITLLIHSWVASCAASLQSIRDQHCPITIAIPLFHFRRTKHDWTLVPFLDRMPETSSSEERDLAFMIPIQPRC